MNIDVFKFTRFFAPRFAACLATLFLSTLAWFQPLQAQNIGIIGHPIFSEKASGASGITNGPDGALWFAASGSIGRITTAGEISSYAFPSGYFLGNAITTGPDGALWFTNNSSSGNPAIGRVTTSGVVSEVYVSSVLGFFRGITTGSDGALWFTESNDQNSFSKIGRLTTTGALTEYALPMANASPLQITCGSDGALWFTESGVAAIGRISTEGSITEYPVPPGPEFEANPQGITSGPDGALWFTADFSSIIGRLTTSGVFSEYNFDAIESSDYGITVAADGAVWFCAYLNSGAAIVRFTPTDGSFSSYLIPQEAQELQAAATATVPDGSVWFTTSSEIGEAISASASLSITPGEGNFDTPITLEGSGFRPGENVNLYAHSTSVNLLATVAADPTGSFSLASTIAKGPGIEQSLVGVGQDSHSIAVGNYGVTNFVSCTPNKGSAGTAVMIGGLGFVPESYQYTILFGDFEIGVVVPDRVGAFVFEYTIPSTFAPGVYSVSVGSAQANFTVN